MNKKAAGGARPDALDTIYFALSDPTRRAILSALAHGELSVGALSEPFDISPPAISKHLAVLERAQLIQRRRIGQTRMVTLCQQRLDAAYRWLARSRGASPHGTVMVLGAAAPSNTDAVNDDFAGVA